MIPNGEKHEAKSEGQRWHYLAIKTLSALLRGITSKHYDDFYCMNCLHSFRIKNKIESHNRVCENRDFRSVIMTSEGIKKLEFDQYQKSDKAPFIFYADLECIIEATDRCKKNPENSSTTKVREHIRPDFLIYLEAEKISTMYTEVKIACKSFVNF